MTFLNLNQFGIRQHSQYYYRLTPHQAKKIREYLKLSLKMYQQNLPAAINMAKKLIAMERPNANEKYIETNGPKFAQEQLRNFVPVIFPTALEFTVNLSALVSLYRSAWNPVMQDVTQQMANLVTAAIPSIRYMFERDCMEDFEIEIENSNLILRDLQHARLIKVPDISDAVIPSPKDMHPVDRLPFKPMYMDNNVINIISEVQISIATMGQDQRHRTIRRGEPMLTGDFYLAPILAELGLNLQALTVMNLWKELPGDLPNSLRVTLAPYGAMVRYTKSASLNAFLHEQHKRGCHCAQQEIYEVSRDLRAQLIESAKIRHKMGELLSAVSPACFFGHGCGEGARYCGRNLAILLASPFPKRLV